MGTLWLWLAEAKHVWLALGVTFIALVISLRPGTSEPVIRLTGLFLQLLGIFTVVWGISETRALFGHSSFSRKARSWLSRFPLLRRSIVVPISGVASIGIAGKVRAIATRGAGPNPTVEARLTALERNIETIHTRISQTQQEMDAEFGKAVDALKREEQLRQSEDRAISEKLEATGTGGVHISATGALWLFVGVTLSTAATEIAAFLR
jgi:hypothetical protein